MSGQRVDVKVVMLGKEYVGKTSLVERYVHDRFLVGPYQNTIGAAFVAKVMSVGDRTVTLGIWDTAGSERYEAMSRIYYRGAKAAIVCYDLTDSSSFERAKFWVKELRSLEEGCQIYLCGTKSDLLEEDRRRRRVDFHDVQDYADNIKAQLFETSSKTGQSVDELFQKVAEDYVSVAAFQVMTAISVPRSLPSTNWPQYQASCSCSEAVTWNVMRPGAASLLPCGGLSPAGGEEVGSRDRCRDDAHSRGRGFPPPLRMCCGGSSRATGTLTRPLSGEVLGKPRGSTQSSHSHGLRGNSSLPSGRVLSCPAEMRRAAHWTLGLQESAHFKLYPLTAQISSPSPHVT